MLELTLWEKMLTVIVQAILFVVIPWQTASRLDVLMVLVVLGIVSVAIVGAVEWLVEHGLHVKLPG